MSKLTVYHPTLKFKNYSLPTAKPNKSQPFHYEPKEESIEEKITKKLEKVEKFLEDRKAKLGTKLDIKNNLEALDKDLYFMKDSLLKKFNAQEKGLKTHKKRIDQMKKNFDHLQTYESGPQEFKKISKIKHVLTELEQLLKPDLQHNTTKAQKEDKGLSQRWKAPKNKSLLTEGKKMVAKKTKKTASAAKKPVKKTVRKTAAKKSVAARPKKAPARSAAKKSTVKKTPARKSTAKKATVRKSPARKSTVKKTAAKKTTARKSTVRKSPARKSTVKKTAAKKTTTRKVSARPKAKTVTRKASSAKKRTASRKSSRK